MCKTFVLIHGSWHGGWAWEAVIRHLEEKGHRAYAPTLAGYEPEAELVGITHQDGVDSVVSYIKQHDLQDAILVGHSLGRTIISRIVEYVPDRIKRLIFLDAFVLEDNQCVYETLPDIYAKTFTQIAQSRPDNKTLIPWELWRDNFMQDASEDRARFFWEQLVPEPYQLYLDRLNLKAFYSLDIPKSFIYSRQDKTMPPGYFHPQMSSRLGNFKLVEMDGGHEVMFTRPEELADKLIEASSD